MKNLMMISVLAVFSTAAHAAGGGSHWQGTGKAYDLNRNVTETYTLDVVVTPEAGGVEKIDVNVVGATGGTYQQSCTQKADGDHWSKTCTDGGKGGGYFFDYGLGQDYYETADGRAYATQIIIDSKDKMRLERTELKNMRAVGFFAEELTRVND